MHWDGIAHGIAHGIAQTGLVSHTAFVLPADGVGPLAPVDPHRGVPNAPRGAEHCLPRAGAGCPNPLVALT